MDVGFGFTRRSSRDLLCNNVDIVNTTELVTLKMATLGNFMWFLPQLKIMKTFLCLSDWQKFKHLAAGRVGHIEEKWGHSYSVDGSEINVTILRGNWQLDTQILQPSKFSSHYLS